MIDVHRLRILREVAERGSFAGAAAVLRLTPSAVSQQVAALERSLGRPVVERSTRGVTLTEPGRVLVEAAETVAAELSAAQRRIEELAAGTAGRLTIATFTSGGQRLLPSAIVELSAAHPDVDLSVLEFEPEDSLPMVRGGQADVALAYHFGTFDVGPGLRWTPLMDDPMLLTLPRAHPLAARTSLNMAEVAGERWIEGCTDSGVQLQTHAALAGFQPRMACWTTDYLFTQSLVAAGAGIALIPSVAIAENMADQVAAVPIEPPTPMRYIGLVTAHRRWPQPLVTDLLNALRRSVPNT